MNLALPNPDLISFKETATLSQLPRDALITLLL